MGLNENLFGFIFDNAKKKKRSKSEDKFKEKIKGMTPSFQEAVSEMISDLVLDNIDYLADIIVRNDPHALAARNANILQMLLNNQKARGIIEGAKKQKRYVKWDTRKILEAIVIILSDRNITFSKNELQWLAKNIHAIGNYIYNN